VSAELPKGATAFERLVDLMAILRANCPWDKKQTHQSLTPYLIEEAYEVLESIETAGPDFDRKLREELGDLLLQVVFHAQLAREEGRFTIDDVAEGIVEKMVRRHPHVFSDVEADTPDQVRRNWEEIKAREKGAGLKKRVSLMEGIPRHLPALLAAERVASRAADVGFEWEAAEGALAKIGEEAREALEAWQAGDHGHAREEMGDVLFACANLCRMMGVISEDALRHTTAKFVRRFGYIEARAAESGRVVSEMASDEMDRLWEESKSAPPKDGAP
jgi:MazG family protein